MEVLEKRLDRFEFQLDEIRSALVQMAKTEERVAIILEQTTQLFQKHSTLQQCVNDLQKESAEKSKEIRDKIAALEKENATQGQSLGFFERASWIVAGAIASIATWFITK